MEKPKSRNLIKFSKLEERLDPWFYHPRYYELEKSITNSKYALKPISEVVEESTSLFDRKHPPSTILNYIEKNDVDSARGVIVSSESYDAQSIPSRATYILREGDFLIPNARDTIHGVVITPKEFEGYICTNRFFVVRPRVDKVIPTYLYHILRQPPILALLKRHSSGEINPGFTVSKTYNTFGKIKIPIPDIIEQENLVKKLLENENKKRKLVEQIEMIDQEVLSLVGTSLPHHNTVLDSLYILGYEYIASF